MRENPDPLSCRHLPACPGCPRFGANDPDPDSVAELRRLCERHGARFEVRVGARREFRGRARLAVRGRGHVAKVGVFAAATHRVVDIPSCPIHHPLINEVAAALKGAMRKLQVSCYDDGHHRGLVRAVQIAIERPSATAQVVVICNDDTPNAALPLLDTLHERLGQRLHSLWWNGNPERTNRVMGSKFHHHSGPDCIVEQIGGAQVFFPPGAFGQSNLGLFGAMVAQIHAAVPAGADLVELFAGSGAIGLGLVASSSSMVFNELGESSLEGLERGLCALDPNCRQRTRVVPGPAELAADAIGPASVVIADPPRKGLGPALLEALDARRPRIIIYVSCGLASLVRDAEALAAQGMRLTSATLYDVFPYTPHVETLAIFRTEAPA